MMRMLCVLNLNHQTLCYQKILYKEKNIIGDNVSKIAMIVILNMNGNNNSRINNDITHWLFHYLFYRQFIYLLLLSI